MIGVLGGTAFLRLLPSWLPWNVARLIGCSPQLLTFAVLPRLLTAIPRDPETAARPIFAEKKVVTSTRTHDRRRISDQTGRKTFRAAQCRSGCRSNDRVGDDGHAPRGLAAGSVEAAGLMTGVAHGRWTHGALPPPPTPIAVVPLGSRPRRMNADLSVRDSSSFACRVSPIVCPSLFTIRCGEHSTETGNFAFDSDERIGRSMKSEKFTVIPSVPRAQIRNRGLHSDIDRGAKNAGSAWFEGAPGRSGPRVVVPVFCCARVAVNLSIRPAGT